MRRELPCLEGRTVRSVRHDESSETWVFDFGDGYLLQVTSPWRITDARRVALGHLDHRQQFGLSEPVDGQSAALALLKDRRVIYAVVLEVTGDLQLDFEQHNRLEVFNESSGYEAWTLSSPDGRMLVALGGGEVDEWD
jgi:hypothetical protein